MLEGTRPLISVIIPTYNRGRWIANAINSVFAQTFTDFEVIVVDDGSTDETRYVIQAYGGTIRYIQQANRGVSAARNRGIREARGRWIAFLDSDDEWVPEKLKLQIDFAEQHRQLVMVASDAYICDGNQSLTLFDIREKIVRDNKNCVIENPLFVVIKTNFFPSSLLIKKDALLDVDMFDERLSYGEDLDLTCRIALVGPLGVVARPLSRIVTRGEGDVNLSTLHERDKRNRYRSGVLTWEKLLRSRKLNVLQQTFVKRDLSADRFYYGLEEYSLGNKRDGLSWMLQSCKDHCSSKSILRVLLFVMVGYSGLMWIQNRKGRTGYWRSDTSLEG